MLIRNGACRCGGLSRPLELRNRQPFGDRRVAVQQEHFEPGSAPCRLC